jgi:N-acetylmuramoyl-L-alanine amidase
MGQVHIVEQGEHLTQIATRYGFSDFHVVWDDPQNANLRERRPNPNVLFPGDEVYIPDPTEKRSSIETGQRHRFQLAGCKLKLRIVLQDYGGKPIAAAACTLEIDDARYKLTTDSRGTIDKEISPTARHGNLSVPDLGIDLPIQVGDLDPVEEPSGFKARLANLGYYLAPPDDSDDSELRSAIEEFQCDNALRADGICGPKTQSKLKEVHGS